MLRTQSGIQVEKWEAKCPQKNKPDDPGAPNEDVVQNHLT